MIRFRFLCATFLGIALSQLMACAWLISQVRPIDPQIFVSFPSTKSLGKRISCVQKVEASRVNDKQNFLAQLEADENHLTLVAFTPFQTRAFTLTYENSQTNFSPGPGMKLDINPSFFMTDLALALWPINQIKPLLAKDLTVDSILNQRIINERGTAIIKIQYSENDSGAPTVRIENMKYGYTLTIEDVDCA